ncbi:calpain family cysteine protease [Ceratobasidium sp. AG-Ba]|nr:calpain family cysteine protease [Ceratobasidium sp. AG-Ba]QRW14150.1 calpain family cysteine protease [Ceratobasidium sp. AG-Ba]
MPVSSTLLWSRLTYLDFSARNRRFRDLEFDLEEDKERCLHGLTPPSHGPFTPADVMRVSEIFDNPTFFVDGATYSDIQQGQVDDCWFMSALATVSTMKDLLDKICVARDEEVGVYGFIFYRDSGWIDIVVDDLLFTCIPQYEELSQPEKSLYHYSRDKFNSEARTGGRTLYFGKSGTENETWVPLIEKAYAKLHGDYAAIDGGLAADAIEDLTGGVSTMFHVHDILNPDRFWQEELSKANQDRLFGCYITKRTGQNDESTLNGLFTNHAYSIISAKKVNGEDLRISLGKRILYFSEKRFLRIRNPWGRAEWTGAWSDGSKEWTPEWLKLLPDLDHKFGDDGEFLMEYEDFLKTWGMIERSILFDGEWKMSSLWLDVSAKPSPCAWDYGDVSFTINVTDDAPAIVVLSQLNERHFSEISGSSRWSFDFSIYRKGANISAPYATSTHTILWSRSVSVELQALEAGDYVVHVRLDRKIFRKREASSEWDSRKLGRVWSGACVSSSIAANFDSTMFGDLLPANPNNFGGRDLTTTEIELHGCTVKAPTGSPARPQLFQVTSPRDPTDLNATLEESDPPNSEGDDGASCSGPADATHTDVSCSPDPQEPTDVVHEDWWCRGCRADPIVGPRAQCRNYNLCETCMGRDVHDKSHRMLCIRDPSEAHTLQNKAPDDDDRIILGLRVYTRGSSKTTISGQLRHGTVIRWKREL